MSIEWNQERMSTGVASIDAQHQVFIRKINQLLDAMEKGEGRDEVDRLIHFLGTYAREHFAHEEHVMEQRLCPARMVNKESHGQFLDNYNTLAEKYKNAGPSLSFVMEVQQLIGEWFVRHICKIDTQLKSCRESD